MTVGDKRI